LPWIAAPDGALRLRSFSTTSKLWSTTVLPAAFLSHFSNVAKRLSPGYWMAQSTTVVMPPAAAAVVPVRKSSAV
jgi:hypothetical protein